MRPINTISYIYFAFGILYGYTHAGQYVILPVLGRLVALLALLAC